MTSISGQNTFGKDNSLCPGGEWQSKRQLRKNAQKKRK